MELVLRLPLHFTQYIWILLAICTVYLVFMLYTWVSLKSSSEQTKCSAEIACANEVAKAISSWINLRCHYFMVNKIYHKLILLFCLFCVGFSLWENIDLETYWNFCWQWKFSWIIFYAYIFFYFTKSSENILIFKILFEFQNSNDYLLASYGWKRDFRASEGISCRSRSGRSIAAVQSPWTQSR